MLRSRAGRVTVGAAGRANPQSISFCGRLHEADGLSEQQETRSCDYSRQPLKIEQLHCGSFG